MVRRGPERTTPLSAAAAAALLQPLSGYHRPDSMIILETERLLIRHLSADDAEFVVELLNQPSFIQYIGDKGVRNA